MKAHLYLNCCKKRIFLGRVIWKVLMALLQQRIKTEAKGSYYQELTLINNKIYFQTRNLKTYFNSISKILRLFNKQIQTKVLAEMLLL